MRAPLKLGVLSGGVFTITVVLRFISQSIGGYSCADKEKVSGANRTRWMGGNFKSSTTRYFRIIYNPGTPFFFFLELCFVQKGP